MGSLITVFPLKPIIDKDETGNLTLKRCGGGRHQLITVTPQVLHKSSPANMISSFHHAHMKTAGIEEDLLFIPHDDCFGDFKLRFRCALLDFMDHLRFIIQLSDCAHSIIHQLISGTIVNKWESISLKFLYVYVTYIWKNCKGFIDMMNHYLTVYPMDFSIIPSSLAHIQHCVISVRDKALTVHQSLRTDAIVLDDLESLRAPLRSIKFGLSLTIKNFEALHTIRHRQIVVHNHDAGQGVSIKQMTKRLSDCLIIRSHKTLIKDDYQSSAGISSQNSCEQTNSGIIANVTSVEPTNNTGIETGFKTKPAGDKYADILKEFDEDKHRNILESSFDISERICCLVNGKMCMGAPLICSVFPERRPAKAPYFTELYPQELADIIKPFVLKNPTKLHKSHPIGSFVVSTLEYYDAHVMEAHGMRCVFYQGMCKLKGTDCEEHETMDISQHFKIPMMSKMLPKESDDEIKWENINKSGFRYLNADNIPIFDENIPCVELDKFWKENKLSVYEFEKKRICNQNISYRMPHWIYVNWSPHNEKKIADLVSRIPAKREWIERWLVNKILGKKIVGDWKRSKDKLIEKCIADNEELIVQNGGLLFNRQRLNQYDEDKQAIPNLVHNIATKTGISAEGVYGEMRAYLEKNYDESDFSADDEEFAEVIEEKAIYSLTPFDTNIVLNRE